MDSFALCRGIPMMKGKEIKARWNADFLKNNMDLLFGINKSNVKK